MKRMSRDLDRANAGPHHAPNRDVISHRARRFGFGLLTAGILAIAGSLPVAADYGNSGGNVQLYQVTASMNCNNPSLCGDFLGGFWAWGVFNQDGTFDAEVTFCGHMSKPAGSGLAGAGHEHADGTYIVTDFGQGPFIVITHEIDVLTGQGKGVTIDSGPEFMPIAPAVKGHYSTLDLLGFSAPGVTFQVTVTPMHT
jgi:hypothetical protein